MAVLVPNPEPKRREVPSFEAMAGVEAVATELGPQFGAIAIVGALTGLRPEEWIALERRDVDRERGPPPRAEGVHGRTGEALREAGR